MNNQLISAVQLLSLPKFDDPRGNLSFLENHSQIPFEIKRVYWIYDVPGGQIRGGHAFKEQEEFIVALSGSFDIEIDDGVSKCIYSLNRSYCGLFIPSGIWRQMENFSTNSVAMVMSSTFFEEDDYIRNYNSFLNYRSSK